MEGNNFHCDVIKSNYVKHVSVGGTKVRSRIGSAG